MSKVYITNDSGLNFAKAEQYGELVRLTRGSIDVWQPEKIRDEIYAKLKGFDATKDFILVAGASMAAAIAGAWLALYADDARDEDSVLVKFLLFDSKKHEYFVRTIPV